MIIGHLTSQIRDNALNNEVLQIRILLIAGMDEKYLSMRKLIDEYLYLEAEILLTEIKERIIKDTSPDDYLLFTLLTSCEQLISVKLLEEEIISQVIEDLKEEEYYDYLLKIKNNK